VNLRPLRLETLLNSLRNQRKSTGSVNLWKSCIHVPRQGWRPNLVQEGILDVSKFYGSEQRWLKVALRSGDLKCWMLDMLWAWWGSRVLV
jgi:hypothetical protein